MNSSMAFSLTSVNSLFSSKFLNKTTVPALANFLITSWASTTANGKSSFFLATLVNSSISALLSPKYTKTTSLSFWNFSTSSTVLSDLVAGPVFSHPVDDFAFFSSSGIFNWLTFDEKFYSGESLNFEFFS